MTEFENELKAVKQIYQHSLSHITDDNKANKVIYILNLHWCVENIIRLATEGWSNIKFNDTFKKILERFNKKKPMAPKIINEVLKLNEIRNGVYHKNILPDFSEIKALLPFVKKFIDWISKNIFNFNLNLDLKLEPDLLLSFKSNAIINKIALNQLKKSRNYKKYYAVKLYLHNIGFNPYTSIDIKLNSIKNKEINYNYIERTESGVQPKSSMEKNTNSQRKDLNNILIGIREKYVKKALSRKSIRIYRKKKIVVFQNIEKVKHNDLKQLDPFMIYIPKISLNDNIVLNYTMTFDQVGGYELQILHITN